MTVNYSLYLHIPFCRHRCAYCDFNTYAGYEAQIPAYVQALCREIKAVGESAPEKLRVHTVFFGGGTPSLLSPAQFEPVLSTIREQFDLLPDAELSLEANPGTVTLANLRSLRALGLNRISFGVQSANPEELHMLERSHSYSDVITAVAWARKAGFDNLNLDLIYGLPGQPLTRWQATVELALGLRPEHLSLYALTIEHGTPFGRWAARGLMAAPDPDLAADMYEWSMERLAAAGYGQYEISNWAQAGRQCRHNLQYWRGDPYLGLGAGAHGFAAGVRYANVLRIKTYIERLQAEPFSVEKFPLTVATVDHHHIGLATEMGEYMMTGLRLTDEGVSMRAFQSRFAKALPDVFGPQIDRFLGLHLLERSGDRLRLTPRGRLLGNQVFMEFVG